MAERDLLDSKCQCSGLIHPTLLFSILHYHTFHSPRLTNPALPCPKNLPYGCLTLYYYLHIIALPYLSYATPPWPTLNYNVISKSSPTLHNQTFNPYLLLCCLTFTYNVNRGSYMSDHVLLNLLNKLGKREHECCFYLSYDIKITLKSHFCRKKVIILLSTQSGYGRHNVSRKSINH